MSHNYAYYNIESGLIENVLFAEPENIGNLELPTGFATVEIPDGLSGEWSACGIGWSYINGQFIEPAYQLQVTAPQDPVQPTVSGAQTL